MEQELNVKTNSHIDGQQKGFILVTALIMLSLLTLLSIGMYMISRSSTQTSSSAQKTTEAYYYAETAINYISWAMNYDAELDSFTYSGAYQSTPFTEPNEPTSASTVGDFQEWGAITMDPGPTVISDTDPLGSSGQLKYFDNTPLSSRSVCFYPEPDPGAGVPLTYPNCIDVKLDTADSRRTGAQPSMFNISTTLPRYIKLEIATDGSITPSIPKLPHRDPNSTPVSGPVVGEDIPDNGAIVWLTAVDATDPDKDIQIFPLDPSGLNGGISPAGCDGGVSTACPCTAPVPLTARACDANTGFWLSSYGVAAYAIGYVNGKASQLLRAVIM